jgi:crotonobetainyl-CoA:carnitine CoA-transferase CaiB-like acyl-CoA transferase
VLIENFKVGGLAKYGLDYPSLSALNPGLVYCSITGFGQTGPYAPRAGYDFIIQGMGGACPDRRAGRRAAEDRRRLCRHLHRPLFASNAILAALRSGTAERQGRHIDMALLDTQVAVLANQALNWMVSGKVPHRMGNGHANLVPYQAFKVADGE